MAVLKSDGLSLLVGDGLVSETFLVLRGAVISRLELAQRLADSTTISGDAWSVGVGTTERRAVIECNLLATDETAAVRIRSLAFDGLAGNFRLNVNPTQALHFKSFVTHYGEMIDAGDIKKLTCRLESSEAISLA